MNIRTVIVTMSRSDSSRVTVQRKGEPDCSVVAVVCPEKQDMIAPGDGLLVERAAKDGGLHEGAEAPEPDALLHRRHAAPASDFALRIHPWQRGADAVVHPANIAARLRGLDNRTRLAGDKELTP